MCGQQDMACDNIHPTRGVIALTQSLRVSQCYLIKCNVLCIETLLPLMLKKAECTAVISYLSFLRHKQARVITLTHSAQHGYVDSGCTLFAKATCSATDGLIIEAYVKQRPAGCVFTSQC